ncbi:MAG: L-threonate dehydrogenase [Pseudomonadota bacterium]
MSEPHNVAVIGLGAMGYGMAASVLRAGHTVWGIDIDPQRMEQFRSEGGADGALSDVAGELDAVLVVVVNAVQTEAVLFGPSGVVPKMKRGSVVLSSATMAPDTAKGFGEQASTHGVHYLDAPISGGAARAANGDLSVMSSGTPDARAAARPVLDAIASTVFELGDAPGAGSAMKAVNQLLAGVHIATMAEAMVFGMTQGISPEKFLEVIPKCAGTSWMLENRAPHIVDSDYTPKSAVTIWPKDLGIVLDIARDAKFSAPITAAALQQYLAAAGQGLGHEDDAAVAKVYAKNVGIALP